MHSLVLAVRRELSRRIAKYGIYTWKSCKLPNRRRSFYCNFLEGSSEGPSANSLMNARYTWSVDGSIIHHVKVQTLPQGLSIPYSISGHATHDQVRKQDHSTPYRAYFSVFSLNDKGVRVSLSARTGRHLTSTSSYIKYGSARCTYSHINMICQL